MLASKLAAWNIPALLPGAAC